jgi:hypothetical protein
VEAARFFRRAATVFVKTLVRLDVFGCSELNLKLNWTENSKSIVKMKWLQIQELLFGCAWNLLLESKSAPNSKSCLDVQTMEFNVLLSLDIINMCICQNKSICILEYICNFLHMLKH